MVSNKSYMLEMFYMVIAFLRNINGWNIQPNVYVGFMFKYSGLNPYSDYQL